jgi:hypothetical protein
VARRRLINDRIHIGDSRTQAGVREIRLLPILKRPSRSTVASDTRPAAGVRN